MGLIRLVLPVLGGVSRSPESAKPSQTTETQSSQSGMCAVSPETTFGATRLVVAESVAAARHPWWVPP